ncbi:hypothetical protein [Streptomyces sp. NBC_01803]|uniref:hypothetical protein n=1 Tax=Streptomyces sp. NBC_01803 TaxID=2975946 RepID=UPI002DDB1335|nr:hypothetical protein [Streptomyces sp. NBC_01803]WSA45991.1 hypothetical protein OIE51_18355 [Streptomyces sp. NBC_01803]
MNTAREPDAVVLVLPLALLMAVVLVVLYHARRSGGRGAYRSVPLRWRGQATAPPSEAGAWAGEPPVEELDAEARGLLIRLDDAVLARIEELDFAAEQAGEEATRPFRAAVADAGAEAGETLRLRHRLDDPAVRRDETERHRRLHEIIGRCAHARARLDSVAGSFGQARGLPGRAAEALENARRRARALPERIDAARARWHELAARYPETALTPVRGHPAAAGERLSAAEGRLRRAERALAEDDERSAADAVRAAERAIGQAETLADGVLRRGRELAAAENARAEAVRAAEHDLAEAPAVPALRDPVTRAQAGLAGALREDDPFAALRRLADTGTPLVRALAPDRDREAGNRRARVLLDHAVLTADSTLSATRDYVTTHRGMVGSAARGRLAEAEHQRDRALATAPHDTTAALPFAWRADALARQARAAAVRDAGSVA